MSEPDDLQLGAKLARMEVLFNAAIKSAVTDHALEWLASAQLLLRIADQDVDVAKEAIHTPAGREAAAREFEALPIEQRKALVQQLTAHWAVNTSAAVKRLWHAAEVLGFARRRSPRMPSRSSPRPISAKTCTSWRRQPSRRRRAQGARMPFLGRGTRCEG